MNINLLIIIFIIGGLVILSFLKITNVTTVNKKANFYFGIFLLLWSSYWLDELLFTVNLDKKDTVFLLIRCIQLFTPISFYLSVLFYSDPNFKLRLNDVKFLTLPVLFLLVIIVQSIVERSLLHLLIVYISPLHALFYLILSLRRILKHQKNIEIFSSNKELINLNWIKHIIYCLTISAFIIVIHSLLFPYGALNTYINLFFLSTIYFVAYFSIKQKEVFPIGYAPQVEIIKKQSEENVQKNKLFDDGELDFYKKKLLKIMRADKPYLDSELNLIKLADLLLLTGHQLSYLINNGFDENFFCFVNKFRVDKAKELLDDDLYKQITILSIGYEAGFNSKTSFNTTFKKMTGYTPSQYRKEVLTYKMVH